MNVVDMLPSGKKLVEVICAGEGVTELEAVEMVVTGGNALYKYLPQVLAYSEELNADCDRLMNEWRGESKSQ